MVAEGRAPLVDFCNRNDPRAQLRNRPDPAHHARGRPRAQLSSFHAPRYMKRSAGGRASRHSQPRFHGPEACEGFRPREASPRRDRSRWRLHPNPIDPDTSCRELVVMQAGVARTSEVPRKGHPVTRSPTSPACAGPANRVASRVLPRRRPRSAAPEVPSTNGPPREGLALSHKLSPACGLETRRLFDLAQSQPVTGMRSARTRVRWNNQLESRHELANPQRLRRLLRLETIRSPMPPPARLNRPP
jgi:hypothetical protein